MLWCARGCHGNSNLTTFEIDQLGVFARVWDTRHRIQYAPPNKHLPINSIVARFRMSNNLFTL